MASEHKTWKRSSAEPFWWSLFAAGGVMAAFFLPVHILVQGILAPLGAESALDYERMRALLANPLARLYLFVLISLPLFHAAHRFRTFLEDLGLRGGHLLVAVLCYGAATAVTLYAAWVLLTAG